MRKKILLSFIVAFITFGLCSCGNRNKENNSTLTVINENANIEELNVIHTSEDLTPVYEEDENMEASSAIDKPKDLIPSIWEFYEENSTIPTPDSTVKGIIFRGIVYDSYMYALSDNLYDASVEFKAYGAVLLGCGFTIEENENELYEILDDSGKMVAVMVAGTEDNGYFLMIWIC